MFQIPSAAIYATVLALFVTAAIFPVVSSAYSTSPSASYKMKGLWTDGDGLTWRLHYYTGGIINGTVLCPASVCSVKEKWKVTGSESHNHFTLNAINKNCPFTYVGIQSSKTSAVVNETNCAHDTYDYIFMTKA